MTVDRGSRDGRLAGSGAAAAPDLRTAVSMALGELTGSAGFASVADRRRLALLLRASAARHRDRRPVGRDPVAPDPTVAVEVACAHLLAGDQEDAYLALHAARDFLPLHAAEHESPREVRVARSPSTPSASDRVAAAPDARQAPRAHPER